MLDVCMGRESRLQRPAAGPCMTVQVEEITLMNTIFIRWDGHRILCPNSKLSADLFTNVTRSQKKGESYRVSS